MPNRPTRLHMRLLEGTCARHRTSLYVRGSRKIFPLGPCRQPLRLHCILLFLDFIFALFHLPLPQIRRHRALGIVPHQAGAHSSDGCRRVGPWMMAKAKRSRSGRFHNTKPYRAAQMERSSVRLQSYPKLPHASLSNKHLHLKLRSSYLPASSIMIGSFPTLVTCRHGVVTRDAAIIASGRCYMTSCKKEQTPSCAAT